MEANRICFLLHRLQFERALPFPLYNVIWSGPPLQFAPAPPSSVYWSAPSSPQASELSSEHSDYLSARSSSWFSNLSGPVLPSSSRGSSVIGPPDHSSAPAQPGPLIPPGQPVAGPSHFPGSYSWLPKSSPAPSLAGSSGSNKKKAEEEDEEGTACSGWQRQRLR